MLSEELKCKDVDTAKVFLNKLKKIGGYEYTTFSGEHVTLYRIRFEYKIYKQPENELYEGVVELSYSSFENDVFLVDLFRFNSEKQIIIEEVYKINEILSLIEKVYDETIDRNTGELKNEK